MAAARKRTEDAVEAAEGSAPIEGAGETAEERPSSLKKGTVVPLERKIFSGKIYEPGEPFPDHLPADVAEAMIAAGEAARA